MIKQLCKKFGMFMSVLLIGISVFSAIPSVTKAESEAVTWTNGSLTGTLTAIESSYKTNIGKTTGKWYWETTVIDDPFPLNSRSMTGITGENVTGDKWQNYAYYGYSGQLLSTIGLVDVRTTYGTNYGNNDVIGIGLDLDNDTVTWYKNGISFGVSIAKPSLLPGTEVFPMITNGTSSQKAITANFGASEFKYPIPEGFLPYQETSLPTTPTDPTPTDPTPTDPQPELSGERALLTVTMTKGIEKEYDLSINEVNAFLSWYNTKDAGVGPSIYAIDKKSNNKGPFTKRTDFVVFNNILMFEVSEYTLSE